MHQTMHSDEFALDIAGTDVVTRVILLIEKIWCWGKQEGQIIK